MRYVFEQSFGVAPFAPVSLLQFLVWVVTRKDQGNRVRDVARDIDTWALEGERLGRLASRAKHARRDV